jgi:hypothetical protein
MMKSESCAATYTPVIIIQIITAKLASTICHDINIHRLIFSSVMF